MHCWRSEASCLSRNVEIIDVYVLFCKKKMEMNYSSHGGNVGYH